MSGHSHEKKHLPPAQKMRLVPAEGVPRPGPVGRFLRWLQTELWPDGLRLKEARLREQEGRALKVIAEAAEIAERARAQRIRNDALEIQHARRASGAGSDSPPAPACQADSPSPEEDTLTEATERLQAIYQRLNREHGLELRLGLESTRDSLDASQNPASEEVPPVDPKPE